MESLSDAVPANSQGRRARTGLTCAAEFRRKNPHKLERAITDWLGEMLRDKGWDAGNERLYPGEPNNGRTCDVHVAVKHEQFWLEAKPIWGDWISDGSSGDRVRQEGYDSGNIAQLLGDADKLRKGIHGPGAWHGLLALVFHENERLTERVVKAVGSEWRHSSIYIPDQCCEADEHFGCTPIVFWREAGSQRGER